MFAGKESDKELAAPGEALATVCANETGTMVVIVSDRLAVPVPPVLVALNVTVDVPAAVGVPEINPDVVFTDRPAGNPVAP